MMHSFRENRVEASPRLTLDPASIQATSGMPPPRPPAAPLALRPFRAPSGVTSVGNDPGIKSSGLNLGSPTFFADGDVTTSNNISARSTRRSSTNSTPLTGTGNTGTPLATQLSCASTGHASVSDTTAFRIVGGANGRSTDTHAEGASGSFDMTPASSSGSAIPTLRLDAAPPVPPSIAKNPRSPKYERRMSNIAIRNRMRLSSSCKDDDAEDCDHVGERILGSGTATLGDHTLLQADAERMSSASPQHVARDILPKRKVAAAQPLAVLMPPLLNRPASAVSRNAAAIECAPEHALPLSSPSMPTPSPLPSWHVQPLPPHQPTEPELLQGGKSARMAAASTSSIQRGNSALESPVLRTGDSGGYDVEFETPGTRRAPHPPMYSFAPLPLVPSITPRRDVVGERNSSRRHSASPPLHLVAETANAAAAREIATPRTAAPISASPAAPDSVSPAAPGSVSPVAPGSVSPAAPGSTGPAAPRSASPTSPPRRVTIGWTDEVAAEMQRQGRLRLQLQREKSTVAIATPRPISARSSFSAFSDVQTGRQFEVLEGPDVSDNVADMAQMGMRHARIQRATDADALRVATTRAAASSEPPAAVSQAMPGPDTESPPPRTGLTDMRGLTLVQASPRIAVDADTDSMGQRQLSQGPGRPGTLGNRCNDDDADGDAYNAVEGVRLLQQIDALLKAADAARSRTAEAQVCAAPTPRARLSQPVAAPPPLPQHTHASLAREQATTVALSVERDAFAKIAQLYYVDEEATRLQGATDLLFAVELSLQQRLAEDAMANGDVLSLQLVCDTLRATVHSRVEAMTQAVSDLQRSCADAEADIAADHSLSRARVHQCDMMAAALTRAGIAVPRAPSCDAMALAGVICSVLGGADAVPSSAATATAAPTTNGIPISVNDASHTDRQG